MGKREQLHQLFKDLIGSSNVYYQPPSSHKIKYPCIIYSRNREKTKFAGNKPYNRQQGYKVTVIDEDPDTAIPDKIAALPMCAFDRPYTVNNLYHYAYNLYY